MMTRLGFMRARITSGILGRGPGNDVVVRWNHTDDGVEDVGTGAVIGPTTMLSGIMRALSHQVAATVQQRQYQEIQAGDLILDLAEPPVVNIFPGQLLESGIVALDALQDRGPRFMHLGQWYAQAAVSDSLAQAWATVAGGQSLTRTVLLRRAT